MPRGFLDTCTFRYFTALLITDIVNVEILVRFANAVFSDRLYTISRLSAENENRLLIKSRERLAPNPCAIRYDWSESRFWIPPTSSIDTSVESVSITREVAP